MSVLQRICEEAGFDVREYSGRGMFGTKCLGVEAEPARIFDAVLSHIEEQLNDRDDEIGRDIRAIRRALADMRTDSMGLGTITYFRAVVFEKVGS